MQISPRACLRASHCTSLPISSLPCIINICEAFVSPYQKPCPEHCALFTHYNISARSILSLYTLYR